MTSRPRAARGSTLVELMVGLAIGLLVLATALAVMTRQAADSRRLLGALRLDHDLHAVTRLVTQHVRRAGHWAAAEDAVWRPGEPDGSRPGTGTGDTTVLGRPLRANPHRRPSPSTDRLDFSYDPRALPSTGDAAALSGVRRQDRSLQFLLAGTAWQALTDDHQLAVTTFAVETDDRDSTVAGPCPDACGDTAGADAPACGPRARRTGVALHLTATAPRLPQWRRSVQRHVQLRNDAVVDGCAS